jgi:hypothetical protein
MKEWSRACGNGFPIQYHNLMSRAFEGDGIVIFTSLARGESYRLCIKGIYFPGLYPVVVQLKSRELACDPDPLET